MNCTHDLAVAFPNGIEEAPRLDINRLVTQAWSDEAVLMRRFAEVLDLVWGRRALVFCKHGAHRSSLVVALLLAGFTSGYPETVMAHLKELRGIVEFEATARYWSGYSILRRFSAPLTALCRRKRATGVLDETRPLGS